VIAILLAACGGDDEAIVAAPPPPPTRHVERARPAPKLPVVVAVVEDGAPADEDHCPDIPEELEGTDYDSCPDPKPVAAPELDRDSDDAIVDVEDRCPDVPDPSSDDDGCPG
jgi:hypothetical protein